MQTFAGNPKLTPRLRNADGRDEFLAFKLVGKEYGIGVQTVRDLRGYDCITSIANAPDYVKKLVDTCGVLIPVFDPRIRFKLSTPNYDIFTAVLVLHIGNRTIGMVVDSVSDVFVAKPEQIRPLQHATNAFDSAFSVGIARVEAAELINPYFVAREMKSTLAE